MHAGIVREQMRGHGLSDYMCMYANTSMFKHKNTARHRGTLPHTPCRCSVQTGAGAPAALHAHISCAPEHLGSVWSVSIQSAPPRNLPHGPDGDKMRVVLVFAGKADEREDC